MQLTGTLSQNLDDDRTAQRATRRALPPDLGGAFAAKGEVVARLDKPVGHGFQANGASPNVTVTDSQATTTPALARSVSRLAIR